VNLSKAYRAVKNNRLTGRAFFKAPEPGYVSIRAACTRAGCKRDLGHDKGIHGEAPGSHRRRGR
jgi:hypothetical protein